MTPEQKAEAERMVSSGCGWQDLVVKFAITEDQARRMVWSHDLVRINAEMDGDK